MVTNFRRLVILLLTTLLLIFQFPIEKKAEEYKACYKYELAFKFNFWVINSRLYYCKGNPPTFYVRHDFQGDVAEHFKTYKGEMLMKFTDSALELEGLNFEEINLSESVTRRIPDDPFFETIKIKDAMEKEWTAIETYSPPALAVAEGCKGWKSEFSMKIGGSDRDFRVIFNSDGYKSHIKFIEVQRKGRIEQEDNVGEFDYEAEYQGTPWLLNYDLNNDGSDEIIIIVNYYRNQDLLVFSTTPEKFKGAKDFSEKVLRCLGNKPDEKAEIFKNGKHIVIPFTNLEFLEKNKEVMKNKEKN